MKNRICPRYKKCKEACHHKTVHEVEDGCGYKCTPNGKIVNCGQATMGEIIIANF